MNVTPPDQARTKPETTEEPSSFSSLSDHVPRKKKEEEKRKEKKKEEEEKKKEEEEKKRRGGGEEKKGEEEKKKIPTTRLELMTLALLARCSNQLS